MKDKILGGLFGLAIGDSLGVPVEFEDRKTLELQPVTGMRGYGTYNQPPGTWSDDSSLAFCLAQSLCDKGELDYGDVADKFVKWYEEGFWTPHGEVFDIGGTTLRAINNLRDGIPPNQAGPDDDYTQSNGGLMRILPLAFYLKAHSFSLPAKMRIIHDVTKITHGHPTCQIASGIYITFALNLLDGLPPQQAYNNTVETVNEYYFGDAWEEYIINFDRIVNGNIALLTKDEIRSGGYVVSTLEAAIWAFLNAENFEQTVLTAVNLGDDTDTVGAIAGGLAGIYYGFEELPRHWIEQLARHQDIYTLAECLFSKFYS